MSNTLHDVPGDRVDQIPIESVAAATATGYVSQWTAPFDCYVQTVKLAFSVAITGADTETKHYNLDDNDISTELANTDFVSGTDAAAGTVSAFYAPTDPGKSLAAGDSLYLEVEKVGSTSLLFPRGNMIVRYRGR